MTLHIINLAITSPKLESVLSQLATGDDVLFMTSSGGQLQNHIAAINACATTNRTNGINMYLLQDGAENAACDTGLTAIDYAGFVKLTTKNNKSVSWY